MFTSHKRSSIDIERSAEPEEDTKTWAADEDDDVAEERKISALTRDEVEEPMKMLRLKDMLLKSNNNSSRYYDDDDDDDGDIYNTCVYDEEENEEESALFKTIVEGDDVASEKGSEKSNDTMMHNNGSNTKNQFSHLDLFSMESSKDDLVGKLSAGEGRDDGDGDNDEKKLKKKSSSIRSKMKGMFSTAGRKKNSIKTDNRDCC